MSDRSTKDRILDAAEDLMLEKSFHSVGLTEILKVVQVPKGSFYHHFDSKEHFGVELLKHYVTNASDYKRRMLLSPEPEPNPRQRLLTYLESNLGAFLEHQGKCPCLVAKLAAEVSDFSEPMRQVLAEGGQEWIGIFEQVIQEGLDKGDLRCAMEPRTAAGIAGDLWMGAMQRASIARDAAPLREVIRFVGDQLLPAP